jgi:hypothetical protein
MADPPAWTIYMEAWATPFLLPMFWVAKRSRATSLLAPPLCAAFILIDDRLYFLLFFAIGVAAAQFRIAWPPTVPRWSIWLGKISFSLYLSHWLLLTAGISALGRPGILLGILSALPVAWLVWRFVEHPSITLSRRVGHLPDKLPLGMGALIGASSTPSQAAQYPDPGRAVRGFAQRRRRRAELAKGNRDMAARRGRVPSPADSSEGKPGCARQPPRTILVWQDIQSPSSPAPPAASAAISPLASPKPVSTSS